MPPELLEAPPAPTRPSTLSDEIRSLARKHRGAGSDLDDLIADILDDAAVDLEWTGAGSWSEHKARMAEWESWAEEAANP